MITPRELRDLEAMAAAPTSKAIRKALLDAADALEARETGSTLNAWESLGMDVAAQLEEIATARVSVTMTEHRAADLIRENQAVLAGIARRLRELLG